MRFWRPRWHCTGRALVEQGGCHAPMHRRCRMPSQSFSRLSLRFWNPLVESVWTDAADQRVWPGRLSRGGCLWPFEARAPRLGPAVAELWPSLHPPPPVPHPGPSTHRSRSSRHSGRPRRPHSARPAHRHSGRRPLGCAPSWLGWVFWGRMRLLYGSPGRVLRCLGPCQPCLPRPANAHRRSPPPPSCRRPRLGRRLALGRPPPPQTPLARRPRRRRLAPRRRPRPAPLAAAPCLGSSRPRRSAPRPRRPLAPPAAGCLGRRPRCGAELFFGVWGRKGAGADLIPLQRLHLTPLTRCGPPSLRSWCPGEGGKGAARRSMSVPGTACPCNGGGPVVDLGASEGLGACFRSAGRTAMHRSPIPLAACFWRAAGVVPLWQACRLGVWREPRVRGRGFRRRRAGGGAAWNSGGAFPEGHGAGWAPRGAQDHGYDRRGRGC